MPSLRRHPPSPSVNPFRSPTAANNPVTACFGFRLLSHIRITAFVSLSFACLCYGRQAGTRRMQLLLVKVAAASKMASQEPPSSAHVRTHLTPCHPLFLVTRLPKVSAASTQRSSPFVRPPQSYQLLSPAHLQHYKSTGRIPCKNKSVLQVTSHVSKSFEL